MDFTAKEKEVFEKQGWAVYTTQEMTRDSILTHLAERSAERSGNWRPQRIKYYKKQLDVYIVPFAAIEWLMKNRTAQGFDFTIYHNEIPHQELWVKWKEGKKTPKEKLEKAIQSGVPQKPSKKK
jgi:hypothetical protein